MKRVALVLLMIVLAVPVPADGPVSRVFRLEHRPAREAVSLVEPLLSPEGSVLVRPRDNSLTVVDDAATVARVAEVLAGFDVAPASYRVRVRLIRGSAKPSPPGVAAGDVPSLPSGLLPYASYREIGGFEAVTKEGERLETSVGGRYSLSFGLRRIASESERVELSRFVLARREGPSKLGGVDIVHTLLQSNVSLLVGQTFVMVATPSEGSGEALLLVVVAERAGAGS
jgi:hypothetical protein